MKRSICIPALAAAAAGAIFIAAAWADVPQPNQPQARLIQKPPLTLLAQIVEIVPAYDDCQMLFAVKGKFFGTAQGNRVVRMKSATKTYEPQVSGWTATQVDCRLAGEFELGRTYKVFLWNTATNKRVSNEFAWTVRTKLSLTHQGYTPGQVIAVGGSLLGSAQGARRLMVGGTQAQVTQWCCEDIVFRVPALPAGSHELFLMEGSLLLSNKIPIQIQ